MSSVSRIAFILLVVFSAIGASLPVMAALRDYGIYLSSIGGSTLLRLDNRLKEDYKGETEEKKITSTTILRTKGFIWDPRFMTVDLNLRYSTSKTEADTYDTDDDSIGFRFNSVLFPRWRYPYLPIRVTASQTNRTVSGDGGGNYETDFTRMSLNWGLTQKHLGRVRTRYAYTLEESTGEGREEDTTLHRFQVNASRGFLKGKWGETHTGYGYHFDSFDDRTENKSDMQHHLFAKNRTKFGKKAKLNSTVLFYQRYYEGRGDALDDDYLFSTQANLRVKQTDRFQHGYSLSLRSDDDSNNYSAATYADYTYTHEFSEYLKGTASTGGAARYMGGSDQESSTQFTGNAAAGIGYLRRYDTYRLNTHYRVDVRTPTWGSGQISRGSQSESVRIGQTASAEVSRQNNPLYSDTVSLRARYLMAEEDSHSYSAGYSFTSRYQYSNKMSSLISGNANASQRSQGDPSYGFGSSAILRYRFGRSARTSVKARQRWRMQGDNEFSLLGIQGILSGQLYRRFNVRFSSELGWTRRIEEIREGDNRPEDEINAMAEISSSMGKLVTSMKYTYREIDFDGNVSSDQTIMFQIQRYFGWRL